MNQVIALIRDGDLRAALVRLWVLSMQRTADNGSVELIQWENARADSEFDAHCKQFCSLLEEGKSVGPILAKAHPLALIRALDEHLALSVPARRPPRLEYEVNGERYWLVRVPALRRSAARAAGQAGNRSSWFRHHAVVPASIQAHGLNLKTRVKQIDAATNARLQILVTERRMRVYVGHFTDGIAIQWETNAGGKGFASGLDDEPMRQTSISAHLQRAAAERADLVIFPELTITPAQRQAVHRWQRDLLDSGNGAPVLVIAGSFHERDQTRQVNRAELIGASGLLLTHEKIRPFGKSQGFAENIASGGTIELAASVLGLIAIPICKDFNDVAGVSWLDIGPDWCLVPSMGGQSSLNAHRAKARELGEIAFGTYSIIANQEVNGTPLAGLVYAKKCETLPGGGSLIELEL